MNALNPEDLEKFIKTRLPKDILKRILEYYYLVANLFNRPIVDTLPFYREGLNYKIRLTLDKKSNKLLFKRLYGMFRDKLAVAKKYLNEI